MKQQLTSDVSNVPDRDTEMGVGGNAAGTLTPSSRRSSLVSGQLLYHPANATALEEPVQEQVSVRTCCKVVLTLTGSWCSSLEMALGVFGANRQ
jgi:hypothetical protein